MKAVVITRNHHLKMIDADLPQMKDDELLIKTLRTGLCSTERELFEQEISPPDGSDFLILGHEAIGEVAEVGSKITQFKKGDIVVPSVRRECGQCDFCNNGRTDMCSTGKYTERGILKLHGFMSEYFVEKETYLTQIPENLRYQAVLLEPFTIGIKAFEEYFKIQKSRLSVGQDLSEKEMLKNVLIIGAGPIGLLTALVAKVCYDVNLICLDIDEEGGIKSVLTNMIGGQYVNMRQYIENGSMNIDSLQKNKGITGVDLIIDASPNPSTCLQLIDLLNFNGAIVHLGLPYGNQGQPVSLLDHYITSLVLKNGVIIGSVNANPTNFKTGVDVMEDSWKRFGDILDKLVTHPFDFTDYKKAFGVQPSGRIKVVLNWE